MKALSIMQPWAWLICAGLKDIENRSWWTDRRGSFLIHAGKRVDRDALADLRRGRHPATGEPWQCQLPAEFATGGIVGEAIIMGCVADSPSPWFFGPYGFVLAGGRHLAFRPYRGMLGWFDVEPPQPEGRAGG